ncbi:MAG: hypothetical protein K2Q09_11270, partial [Phycisphaerales bacterium]|nr:hypothetical protein [Phycisphaerales bacterium]
MPPPSKIARRCPGRLYAATAAVLALVLLAGAAVYGVVTIARSTPAAGTGAGTGGAGGRFGIAAGEVLAKANELAVSGSARPEERLALLGPAVEAYPEDQELRIALAHAHHDRKDWASAYTAMETAIAIGPETAALHAAAGTYANAAGLLGRSIEHYTRAKQLEPKNAVHPLYLGMVQIKAGRDREAMASLVTATVLNPDLAAAWGSMGELELRNNQLGLALQHLERARAIQPESLKWRVAEAKVHKRQNEPQRALDLLVNLPEKERYSAEAVSVVADALAMLQQGERRAEYLRAAEVFVRVQLEQQQVGFDIGEKVVV